MVCAPKPLALSCGQQCAFWVKKIVMCRTRVSAPSVRSRRRVDIDDSAPLTDGSVPPVDISLPRSRTQALDLRTEALSFVARR